MLNVNITELINSGKDEDDSQSIHFHDNDYKPQKFVDKNLK